MRSADNITNAVACLHWLHIPGWIEYKVAVLTYKQYSELSLGVWECPEAHGSVLLWYFGPLVTPSYWPTDIMLWWHQSSAGATYQAFNSR